MNPATTLKSTDARPCDLDAMRARVEALFQPHSGARYPGSVGMEVEVIPVSLVDGRRVMPQTGSGLVLDPVLRELAVVHGWTPGHSAAGAPSYRLPGGGLISWEPGGQLEYATPPWGHLCAAVDDARATMLLISRAAREQGIGLLSRGMDPTTPVERTALILDNPRYQRMTAHYDRSGRHGIRMMRLTAGIHVNLDLGRAPLERWDAANRIVPGLMAAFANSSSSHSATGAARSHRATQWRHLDQSRTGCITANDDPIESYWHFALGAEAFLLGSEADPARPFRDWVGVATLADWDRHLTTLFPEVRPRGYLELRFFDALPAAAYDLPLAVAVGLLYDDENVAWIRETVLEPSRDRLVRAGEGGLGDDGLRSEAVALVYRAADGLERLGPAAAPAYQGERLRVFARGWLAEGRDFGATSATMVDDSVTA